MQACDAVPIDCWFAIFLLLEIVASSIDRLSTRENEGEGLLNTFLFIASVEKT